MIPENGLHLYHIADEIKSR